jgi:hypothetical protein
MLEEVTTSQDDMKVIYRPKHKKDQPAIIENAEK